MAWRRLSSPASSIVVFSSVPAVGLERRVVFPRGPCVGSALLEHRGVQHDECTGLAALLVGDGIGESGASEVVHEEDAGETFREVALHRLRDRFERRDHFGAQLVGRARSARMLRVTVGQVIEREQVDDLPGRGADALLEGKGECGFPECEPLHGARGKGPRGAFRIAGPARRRGLRSSA